MKIVERVESASASLLAFPVRSSATAVQNVKMCHQICMKKTVKSLILTETHTHTHTKKNMFCLFYIWFSYLCFLKWHKARWDLLLLLLLFLPLVLLLPTIIFVCILSTWHWDRRCWFKWFNKTQKSMYALYFCLCFIDLKCSYPIRLLTFWVYKHLDFL